MNAPVHWEDHWDHQIVIPLVLAYVRDVGRPPLLVDTQIEDYLCSLDVPPRIDRPRLRHAISIALRRAGYVRRSCRGKAWDRGDIVRLNGDSTVFPVPYNMPQMRSSSMGPAEGDRS